MKLENFISDLLYRYDLVIIPDFGGIVTRKKSARYDKDSFIFSPPHKELSFNNQLKENDGLLANYISDILNISYSEALKSIAEEVTRWQEILKNEKRLKLDQIGIFNLVNSDKVIFLPLTTKNYLAEAYGLTSFVHKPLKTHVKIAKPIDFSVNKPEIQPIVNPKIRQSVPKKVKQQNDFKFWKYAAAFVVGLGLFTTGISWLKSQNHIKEPQFQKATFVLEKDFPAVTIQKSPIIKKTKIHEVTEKKYFLISGAFRNKSNAEKKLKLLQKSGFPAQIIGKNKYGLWMVSIKDFVSNEVAHSALKSLKKTQPGLWVYIKE